MKANQSDSLVQRPGLCDMRCESLRQNRPSKPTQAATAPTERADHCPGRPNWAGVQLADPAHPLPTALLPARQRPTPMTPERLPVCAENEIKVKRGPPQSVRMTDLLSLSAEPRPNFTQLLKTPVLCLTSDSLMENL